MDQIKYMQKDGSSLEVPIFRGKTIDKMPELIARGYTPISVAGIMEQRIKDWESGNQELVGVWEKNHFGSGDGIMYHPNGKIKVVPDSQTLRSVNPYTPLEWHGAQVLVEGTFDKTQGYEFSREQIDKFANKSQTQKEVLNNPIWLALVKGDNELLKEYVGQFFSSIDRTESMSVWISSAPLFEAERLWCLNGIGVESDIDGNSNGRLNGGRNRLVGVPQKGLEKRLI